MYALVNDHLIQTFNEDPTEFMAFGNTSDSLYLVDPVGKIKSWDLSLFSDPNKVPQPTAIVSNDCGCAPTASACEFTPTSAPVSTATPSATPTVSAPQVQNKPENNPIRATQMVVDEPKTNFTFWSDDGTRLAVVSRSTIDIFEVGTDQPLHRLPHSSFIQAVQFSESKTLLAVEISNDHVDVWDLETENGHPFL